MRKSDLHTVRRMVDALAGLSWEDAISHLCLCTQVKGAQMLGVSATKHRRAADLFAKDYAEALARYLANIAEDEEAMERSN